MADLKNKAMKQLTQTQLEQVYREHPEWLFDLEAGKWYKLPDDDNFLFCVTELIWSRHAYGYGWDKSGEWNDVDERRWGTDNTIPATYEEVESALIAEAKRRYKQPENVSWNLLPSSKDDDIYDFNDWHYEKTDNSLYSAPDGKGGRLVFRDGKWATVVTTEYSLTADIQALKDKYPNYNWTIIAEAK